MLRSADPADAPLRDLLGADLADPGRHAEALALLRANPALERARSDTRHWVDAARADILSLPDVPVRAAFVSLCDFVVTRTG